MTTPNYVNENKIKHLKNSGLIMVQVGLQSGSDDIVKNIFNRISLQNDFLNATRTLKKFGISAFIDVILDNPFESKHDTIQTIKTIAQVPKPFYAGFYSLIFFYGTDLYEKIKNDKPQLLIDSIYKDNFSCKKNLLNEMARLAVYLNTKQSYKLVELYLREESRFLFFSYLIYYKLLSIIFYQPVLDFKLLVHYNNGSIYKAIKSIPVFFSEWLKRKRWSYK